MLHFLFWIANNKNEETVIYQDAANNTTRTTIDDNVLVPTLIDNTTELVLQLFAKTNKLE